MQASCVAVRRPGRRIAFPHGILLVLRPMNSPDQPEAPTSWQRDVELGTSGGSRHVVSEMIVGIVQTRVTLLHSKKRRPVYPANNGQSRG